MKLHHLVPSALILVTSTLIASGRQPEPQSPILKKVFSSEPSGKPVSIGKVRATAKPGDTLTLKGRVMGNAKPFVEGRSIFIVGDPEILTACSDHPDDACETPWDNCCDAPELIREGTATVQVLDAKGRVLKEGIENLKGLKKLSYVTVSGKVAPGSSSSLLLLNADAIRVEGEDRAK